MEMTDQEWIDLKMTDQEWIDFLTRFTGYKPDFPSSTLDYRARVRPAYLSHSLLSVVWK